MIRGRCSECGKTITYGTEKNWRAEYERVVADRLALTDQIDALPSETIDAATGMPVIGASHWVGRAEVMALLALPGLAPTSEGPE